jgi:hypothetical protein
MKHKAAAVLMCAVFASGCASQFTTEALNRAKVGCAQGYSDACSQTPALQALADHEANENAMKAAVLLVLFPLVILMSK